MDLGRFKQSLSEPNPPERASPELAALWHAAKGGWDSAHQLVQNEETREAAWVHAHLHRIEGDLDNAGYWYGRAKRSRSDRPLPEEWDEIAKALLESDVA